jgi:hypothetical protein
MIFLLLFSLFYASSLQAQEEIACLPPPTCQLCAVLIEWPLDFNGDDLAEKAQLRKCNSLTQMPNEEMVIIFNHQAEPIIYKSNLMSCYQEQTVHFGFFQRYDFNQDLRDELILVQTNADNGQQELKIIGYNLAQQIISELPLIEYETDLAALFTGNLDDLQGYLVKILPPAGFVWGLKIPGSNLGFLVYYYQDAANSAFYPLKIKKVKFKKQAI